MLIDYYSSLHDFLKSSVMAEAKIITSHDALLIKNISRHFFFFPNLIFIGVVCEYMFICIYFLATQGGCGILVP